jgi:hypothetical protein
MCGMDSKTFPIKGGQYYQFRALRRTENVASPRRSVLARILWRDEKGRAVRHDGSGAKSYAPGEAPVSEPEYPTERSMSEAGWIEVSDVYQAPAKATQAIVELHLRWATRAQVEWSEVTLTETAAAAAKFAWLSIPAADGGGELPALRAVYREGIPEGRSGRAR